MQDQPLLFTTPAKRSFRSHQVPKRHCSTPILIAAIFTIIWLPYYLTARFRTTHLPTSENEQIDSRKSITISLPLMSSYLDSYCSHGLKYKQKSIEAINSLLLLLSNSSSSLQAGDSQIRCQSLFFSKQQKEKKSNRLQIGLPVQIKSKYNVYGRSKMIQLPLFIVKNSKVTTPLKLSIVEQIYSFFSKPDEYQGIDHILQKGNNIAWKPNSPTVSIIVRSNKRFKPTAIQITLERVNDEKMTLIGLSITLQQKTALVNLGTFQVHPGINRINCLASGCQDEHDALILKMGSADVLHIVLFEAKKIFDDR